MESGRDEQIRKRAHEIWEQEGRPEGKEKDHWERAQREVGEGNQSALAAEHGQNLPPLADTRPVKKTRTPPKPGAKAEAAKAGAAKTAEAGTARKTAAAKKA